MSKDQDQSLQCAFFFADGRRCKLPQSVDDMGLCYFHAHKYRKEVIGEQAGRQIAEFLSTDILTACDLSAALSTLFSATAQGFIKPKTAATLAYLGQLMLQAQRLAKEEFLQSFETRWPTIVQEANIFNEPDPEPAPEPATSPAPNAAAPATPPDGQQFSDQPDEDNPATPEKLM